MHQQQRDVLRFMTVARQAVGSKRPAVPGGLHASISDRLHYMSAECGQLASLAAQAVDERDSAADQLATLRARLIVEEAGEFCAALAKEDVVEAADAIADLLYVVYGAAVAFGIDVEPIWDEVHGSNMNKLLDCPKCEGPKPGGLVPRCIVCGGEGKVAVFVGNKVAKPEGWEPPDIARCIREQRERAFDPK